MKYITRREGARLLGQNSVVIPGTGMPPSYQHVDNKWRLAVQQGLVDDVMFGSHRGINPSQLISLYRDHPKFVFGRVGRKAKHQCANEDATCKGRRIRQGEAWVCQVHETGIQKGV